MLPRKEFKRIAVPGTAPLPPKTRSVTPKTPRAPKLPKYCYFVDYGNNEIVKVQKARSLKAARVLADAERRAAGLHTNAMFIVGRSRRIRTSGSSIAIVFGGRGDRTQTSAVG